MKLRIASLSLLALTLVTIQAMAQTVYSNGAINGNTDAWTINFGFIVSDTFNVTNNNTTITGGSFGMWLFSGDTLSSAEVSITSGENSGTSYFDQTLNFTQGACTVNQYGYNVCQENTTFNGPTLNAGSYWLNLQNTSIPNGDPAYWDENSGPSKASENSVGSIPSEAFTVLGSSTTTSSTTSSTTTSVPEPSSIMLFGSGILGLASLVRRKLF
ncbi:MAG: PEP-CTERM sorting domain-containing protein [Candidatus Korobacteraceae bacterium]